MIALLLAWGTAAWAGPCAEAGDGFVVGPATAGLASGGLGMPRRTCPRTEVGATVFGDLTADTANFYGYVTGGLALDGSWAAHPEVEITGRLDAVRLDLGIASLSSTTLGLGDLSLGVAWGRDLDDVVAVGVRTALVVPTATPLYQQGRPFGLDLWVTSVQQVHPMVRVHEGVGGQLTASAGGPADPHAGVTVDAGVEVRPVTVFGLAVDVDASLLRTATLDHLAVSPALRFGDGRRFGFDLGVRLPLLGAERSLLALQLRFVARLGPVEARR
ncbi:MAG: hypothetical protein H6732_18715 [Alphaproteobacteria bacterium]|nr:hypothetical protein [Alphaproteobacteria bacterium]